MNVCTSDSTAQGKHLSRLSRRDVDDGATWLASTLGRLLLSAMEALAELADRGHQRERGDDR
jgi:hypothetical protein